MRLKAPQRREQLIAVAAELFLQHSYDAVTVEMIAARTGITGPGLYRHFQNKQALLIAVLEEPTQVVHEIGVAHPEAHGDEAAVGLVVFARMRKKLQWGDLSDRGRK